MLWQTITAANVAIATAYFCISWIIFSGLRATEQLGTNKLATATAMIFFTCAVHHGSHAVHMLLPSFGVEDPKALALRNAWHWQTAAWDVLGAAVAFYYLSLRGSYASVLRGAQMFEDFKDRERRALEINDNIVQGLVVAKYSSQRGDDAAAIAAIDDTLVRARQLISEQLQWVGEQSGTGIKPGDLARQSASEVRVGAPPPSPAAPPDAPSAG